MTSAKVSPERLNPNVHLCDGCNENCGGGIVDEDDHGCSVCGSENAPHVYVPAFSTREEAMETAAKALVAEAVDAIKKIAGGARSGPRHGVTDREAMLYDKGHDDALDHVQSFLALSTPTVPARCPKSRQGDSKRCVRPVGHPGDCAASWGSLTADFGHDVPDPREVALELVERILSSTGDDAPATLAAHVVGALGRANLLSAARPSSPTGAAVEKLRELGIGIVKEDGTPLSEEGTRRCLAALLEPTNEQKE